MKKRSSEYVNRKVFALFVLSMLFIVGLSISVFAEVFHDARLTKPGQFGETVEVGDYTFPRNVGISTRTTNSVLTVNGTFTINQSGTLRVLVDSNGLVGINATTLGRGALNVSGLIHSNVNGFMFPDGTIQTSADTGGTQSGWTVGAGTIYNHSTQVGIGIRNPTAKLHVNGTGIALNVTGNVSIEGESFTVGLGNSASGGYSAAFGSLTTASGLYSAAFGLDTTASGNDAAAFGYLTNAAGNEAFATGFLSNAVGQDSAAFGHGTNASGQRSVAFGYITNASGDHATSFGNGTIASGRSSTAFGLSTIASGVNSFVVGNQTNATGINSVALGNNIGVSGNNSVGVGVGVGGGNILSSGVFAIMGGNVGINTTNPQNSALNVSGLIHSNVNGFMFPDGTIQTTASSGGSGGGWTASGSLLYNDTNGVLVGIGIAAPSAALHINGTGVLLNISNSTHSFLYVNSTTGRVGVGTTLPQNTLNVVGTANVTTSLIVNDAVINPDTNATNTVVNVSDDWINLNQLNYNGEFGWQNLTNYPSACSAGEFVTTIGDTVTCVAAASIVDGAVNSTVWNKSATQVILHRTDDEVGIGVANPDQKVDILDDSTTDGRMSLKVRQTGAAATGYAIHANKTGAGTNNIAGLFAASGGTNNYALVTINGAVGIGTRFPEGLVNIFGTGALLNVTNSTQNTTIFLATGEGVGVRNSEVGTAALNITGVVHSNTGGFQFPDGTIQTTAGGADTNATNTVVNISDDWVQLSTNSYNGALGFGNVTNHEKVIDGLFNSSAWNSTDTGVILHNTVYAVGIGYQRSPPAGISINATSQSVNTIQTVNASGTVGLYQNGLLRVGINNSNPGTAWLNVSGIIHSDVGGFQFPDGTVQTTAGAAAVGDGSQNSTAWNRTGSTVVLHNVDDNVGIGMAASNKLDVNGTVAFHGSLGVDNRITFDTAKDDKMYAVVNSGNLTTPANALPLVLQSLGGNGSVVGINNTLPGTAVLNVTGLIHSNQRGYMFPDGTVQTTAGGADTNATNTVVNVSDDWIQLSTNSYNGALGFGNVTNHEKVIDGLFNSSAWNRTASGTVILNQIGDFVGIGYQRVPPATLAVNSSSQDNPTFQTVNASGTVGLYQDGRLRVGINNSNPGTAWLNVSGIIHSDVGGFQFPDGTIQTTASTGGASDGTINSTAWNMSNGQIITHIPNTLVSIGVVGNGNSFLSVAGQGNFTGYLLAEGASLGTGASNPTTNSVLYVDGAGAGGLASINATSRVIIGTDSGIQNSILSVGGNINVSGLVHSTSGGFQFPDGTIQTTAGAAAVGDGTINSTAWNGTGDGYVTLHNPTNFVGIGQLGLGSLVPLTVNGSGGFRIFEPVGLGHEARIDITGGLDAGSNEPLLQIDVRNSTEDGVVVFGNNGLAGGLRVGIETPSPNSTFQVEGSFATALTTVTGNYTITATDQIIEINPSTTCLNLSLPTAVGVRGRLYSIKMSHDFVSGCSSSEVNSRDNEFIDSAGSTSLGSFGRLELISNNSDWLIINNG